MTCITQVARAGSRSGRERAAASQIDAIRRETTEQLDTLRRDTHAQLLAARAEITAAAEERAAHGYASRTSGTRAEFRDCGI